MQIYTYNFSDPLPYITHKKPIKLIIKGQEQNTYDWTQVVKNICLYLYKDPKTNSKIHEIGCNYNDRYIKKTCRFGFYIDEYKTMQLTNGKEDLYLDIEVKGFNANRTLKLAQDVLKECKVDLHDFCVIYTAQNQTINYQDINLKSEIEKIQEKYKIDTNNILVPDIISTTSIINDTITQDEESINANINHEVLLGDNQETSNNEVFQENTETNNTLTTILDGKEQSIPQNDIIEPFQEEDVNTVEPKQAQPTSGEAEGRKRDYYGFRYERNPQNRKKALEIHGTTCYACGFNYEKTYGPFGKDYIEIHHINPLAQQDSEVEINPETDLIPLCANCHRMIHHTKPCLSLEELKELIKQNENKNK